MHLIKETHAPTHTLDRKGNCLMRVLVKAVCFVSISQIKGKLGQMDFLQGLSE